MINLYSSGSPCLKRLVSSGKFVCRVLGLCGFTENRCSHTGGFRRLSSFLGLVILMNQSLRADRIGHWSFDVDFRDTEGRFHGTAVGNASVRSDSPSPLGGSYLQLDGRGDYVTVGNPVPSTGSYTKLAWARYQGAPDAWANLFTAGDSGGGHGLLHRDGTMWAIHGGEEPHRWLDSGAAVVAETWIHWAVSYDHSSNILTIYRDGQAQATMAPSSGVGDHINPDRIGAYETMSFWKGQIDDVQLWNEALTQSEVLFIKDTGKVVTEGFRTWMQKYGGITGRGRHPDADPDGDGRSNFGEYAFGSDPSRVDASKVDIQLMEASGQVELTFIRPASTSSQSLTYSIEHRRRLGSSSWGEISSTQVGSPVSQQGGATEKVTLRLSQTLSDYGRSSFFRVRVNLTSLPLSEVRSASP